MLLVSVKPKFGPPGKKKVSLHFLLSSKRADDFVFVDFDKYRRLIWKHKRGKDVFYTNFMYVNPRRLKIILC